MTTLERGESAQVKWCNKCKVEKSVEDFWKSQYNCKSCQRQHRILFRDPQKGRDSAWQSAIAKRGLSVDDYLHLLEKQNGVCAICFRPEKGDKRLAVDHCHVTNVVRGLLCRRCNMA